MRTVTVVTKSGLVNDETEDIELLDSGDVKKLIQQSLNTIRKDLEEHDKNISNLNGKIATLERNVSAQKESIDALDDKSKQISCTLEELKLKIDNIIKDMGNALRSDFIQKCSEDVRGYFQSLVEYAEKLAGDAEALKNVQRNIDEQYAAIFAIAQYFRDCYKADLKHREEELLQETQRLAVLTSCLPQSQNRDGTSE